MKRKLSVALLLLISIAALAQRGHYDGVLLSINSATGVYAKGDTVVISASLTDSAADSLHTMKVMEGGFDSYLALAGKRPVRTDIILSREPKVIYRAAFDRPVHILVSVSPSEDSRSRTDVGFLVAPEEFRPGYEVPSDFVQYWDDQKASLRRSRMRVRKTRVALASEEDNARFDAFDVELSMPEGNPARGYLVMPKGARMGSLPIYVYLHSAGVNKVWCKSSLDNALKGAKYGGGCIAFDLNAHGMLNGREDAYYDALDAGELKGYAARPLTTRDDFYFRLMYLREVRMMDYLCGLKEWDGRRVLVFGESQGGGQAEAIAGLDSRVGAVVATVPAITDFGGMYEGHQCGWPAAYGAASLTDLGRSILPYFDGALMLQFTRARLFTVAGGIDDTCNPAGVHAAFNACPSEHKVIYDHPFRWHSATNDPYEKGWFQTIGAARYAFIQDYLK